MVTCVAALHHMDPVAALAAMSKLLVPGGILVIVGLARSRPPDWPLDAAAVVINLGYRMAKGYWEQPSPTVWPPPHSYREIRALATEALPGVSYRRHLLCGGTPWSGSSQHPKTWAVLEIGHSYDPAAGVLRRCSSHGRGAGQVTERSIGK
jgi:SAM-dependent methyltransferase